MLSERKSVISTENRSLGEGPKLPKSVVSLLYSKKEPLVTVPTEQITNPQGGDQPPAEVPESVLTASVVFTGEDFEVPSDLIAKWTSAYPTIDVQAEIARAAAWAVGKRPKKDWRRFLVNWLASQFRAAGAADETGVPVDKIIDLYHAVCPGFAAVSVRADVALRRLIVERWKESPAHQSSQFWQPFFEKASRRTDVFFRGQRVTPRLEALVSRAVFREISEAAQ